MPADRLCYGLCVANVGSYADPKAVVRLGTTAERSGWEGLFLWDHLAFVWGPPSGDPWVILAAVASATSHIRLGTTVTPVARRRPQVLAQTLSTLDRLSDGRIILGAGLGGVPAEFTSFGEEARPAVRAARLDEGLELVARLLAGERIDHEGPHFTVLDVVLAPLPVQERIPIWIGGTSPAALARAARWDGWVADSADEHGMTMSTEEVAAKAKALAARRGSNSACEIAVIGHSQAGDGDTPAAYAAAGASWWLENVHDLRGSPDELLRRVEAGPPRA